MLQQTQVATVVPYYRRFIAALPTVASLADASIDTVLALWSGLGYYRRAHLLHRAARIVASEHAGEFPRDPAALARLPGVGRSTANAIAAFAFGVRAPILEGNVKRVLARHRGIEGYPGSPAVANALWSLADALTPERDIEAYTQGMMDLGAAVCVRGVPRCAECPVAEDCFAFHAGRAQELPTPRPHRVLPKRRALALFIEHHDRILFLRRPAVGIWAGLLCVPDLPLAADHADAGDPHGAMVEHCRAAYGLAVEPLERLPDLRHAFTHFELTLVPFRLRPRPGTEGSTLHDSAARWLSPSEALAAGVPTPIRNLLRGHYRGAR